MKTGFLRKKYRIPLYQVFFFETLEPSETLSLCSLHELRFFRRSPCIQTQFIQCAYCSFSWSSYTRTCQVVLKEFYYFEPVVNKFSFCLLCDQLLKIAALVRVFFVQPLMVIMFSCLKTFQMQDSFLKKIPRNEIVSFPYSKNGWITKDLTLRRKKTNHKPK